LTKDNPLTMLLIRRLAAALQMSDGKLALELAGAGPVVAGDRTKAEINESMTREHAESRPAPAVAAHATKGARRDPEKSANKANSQSVEVQQKKELKTQNTAKWGNGQSQFSEDSVPSPGEPQDRPARAAAAGEGGEMITAPGRRPVF
jgi:hypothetical protein